MILEEYCENTQGGFLLKGTLQFVGIYLTKYIQHTYIFVDYQDRDYYYSDNRLELKTFMMCIDDDDDGDDIHFFRFNYEYYWRHS